MSSSSSILLVGGSGFIGRALAARLADEGRDVHVLSRRPVLNLPVGVEGHVGDQGDPHVMHPLLDQCPEIIHLASATTPGDTVWSPRVEAERTLMPGLHFLECLQDFPQSRVIFVSSGGTLYGNVDSAAETSLPAPKSYYGAGKLALEAFFSVLGQRRPGPVTILRPTNIYGPGQDLKPGFGIIRTLLERAKDGGDVTLWGDGGSVRDYLYIDDMVAACYHALNGPAGVYNLGAGIGTSLIDLIELVQQVTTRKLSVKRLPARASDVRHIVLDISHAKADLGWQPAVNLKAGLERSWASLLI